MIDEALKIRDTRIWTYCLRCGASYAKVSGDAGVTCPPCTRYVLMPDMYEDPCLAIDRLNRESGWIENVLEFNNAVRTEVALEDDS